MRLCDYPELLSVLSPFEDACGPANVKTEFIIKIQKKTVSICKFNLLLNNVKGIKSF